MKISCARPPQSNLLTPLFTTIPFLSPDNLLWSQNCTGDRVPKMQYFRPASSSLNRHASPCLNSDLNLLESGNGRVTLFTLPFLTKDTCVSNKGLPPSMINLSENGAAQGLPPCRSAAQSRYGHFLRKAALRQQSHYGSTQTPVRSSDSTGRIPSANTNIILGGISG